MTAGSRGDQTMRWLRIAALVVIALVAVRTMTTFRVLHPVASTPETVTEHASSLSQVPGGADDAAIEARAIRRVRQIQPTLTPFLALLALFALVTLGQRTGRPDLQVLPYSSRAVPATGGRGPPLLLH